jgi:hypothetical protein
MITLGYCEMVLVQPFAASRDAWLPSRDGAIHHRDGPSSAADGDRVQFVEWMQPRDHLAAGRTVSTLSLVAAGVTLIFAAVQLAESGAERNHRRTRPP